MNEGWMTQDIQNHQLIATDDSTHILIIHCRYLDKVDGNTTRLYHAYYNPFRMSCLHHLYDNSSIMKSTHTVFLSIYQSAVNGYVIITEQQMKDSNKPSRSEWMTIMRKAPKAEWLIGNCSDKKFCFHHQSGSTQHKFTQINITFFDFPDPEVSVTSTPPFPGQYSTYPVVVKNATQFGPISSTFWEMCSSFISYEIETIMCEKLPKHV